MFASPPSFTPIPFKLYRCLGHGLKMRILFGYNPQIIFCHFFSQNECRGNVEGIEQHFV